MFSSKILLIVYKQLESRSIKEYSVFKLMRSRRLTALCACNFTYRCKHVSQEKTRARSIHVTRVYFRLESVTCVWLWATDRSLAIRSPAVCCKGQWEVLALPGWNSMLSSISSPWGGTEFQVLNTFIFWI